ncbi:MAG: glycosyltransferase [Chloroflexia bacterium]|nr:glycosyltransferase [Chloroflexia bacterium]
MTRLHEVPVAPVSIERFTSIVGTAAMDHARQRAEWARQRLRGRTFWHVNSTSQGGGVAEMLQALLPYVRGAGIDTRWLIIEGSADFFRITKRLHHALHGSPGDGSPLGPAERETYEARLRAQRGQLLDQVKAGDVVLLHDPQTAGFVGPLVDAGAMVIWRCHVGSDDTNEETRLGWAFLAPYLNRMAALVFSREAYIPGTVDRSRAVVIAPSIDAFSAKNQALDAPVTRAILEVANLTKGEASPAQARFRRDDGSEGHVGRPAVVVRSGDAPPWGAPLLTQVSRWDPLKDHLGVMRAFASLVDEGGARDAHLVLAGPDVAAVADDPEGAGTYADLLSAWEGLPDESRGRIHLANLPMADAEENAAIVNALQRHASVVVQKSLQEGFGLTVTEAMWKARPIIASAVGGIRDQIVDGEHGILLDDPADLGAAARAMRRLLDDREMARGLGFAARDRVQERYLGIRHLLQYVELLERRDGG